MGNHLQKKLSKEDFDFLEYNTDFEKLHIIDYYKDFMKRHPDGFMTTEEFSDFISGYYKDRSDSLSEHYIRAADKDKSGKINFKEFLLFLNHECTTNPRERLNWMFDLFDITGNGIIDRKEMTKLYQTALDLNGKKTAFGRTAEEISDKVFKRCDDNMNNELTKEEFIINFMEDPVLFAIFCRTSDYNCFDAIQLTASY